MQTNAQLHRTQAMTRWLAGASALAMIAIMHLSRLFWGARVLSHYDDDFFFYLKTAINFDQLGRSTFDTIHLTNGYHPLWFIVIAALYRIAGTHFFQVFEVMQCALSALTYLYFRKLLLQFSTNDLLIESLSLAILCFTLIFNRGGMEISLCIPLAVAMLVFRMRMGEAASRKSVALYGLLASLTVLARLDSAILVALLLAGDIWRQRQSARRFVLSFSIGGLLVPAYVLSNRIWFGVWMPISGQAKQLRLHHWPAMGIPRSVFAATSPQIFFMVWLACVLAVWSGFWLRRTTLTPRVKHMLVAMLLFTPAHILLLSIMSDWIIWSWYLYTLCFIYLAFGILLCHYYSARAVRGLPLLLWAECALLIGYVCVAVVAHRYHRQQLYDEDISLAAFINANPGLYAIGDRGGLLSYMITSPILQTEGLVMDKEFLDVLQRQEDLSTVLHRYGVKFYITPIADRGNGCSQAMEPAQAGPDSPKLKTIVCNHDAIFSPRPGDFEEIIPIERLPGRATDPLSHDMSIRR